MRLESLPGQTNYTGPTSPEATGGPGARGKGKRSSDRLSTRAWPDSEPHCNNRPDDRFPSERSIPHTPSAIQRGLLQGYPENRRKADTDFGKPHSGNTPRFTTRPATGRHTGPNDVQIGPRSVGPSLKRRQARNAPQRKQTPDSLMEGTRVANAKRFRSPSRNGAQGIRRSMRGRWPGCTRIGYAALSVEPCSSSLANSRSGTRQGCLYCSRLPPSRF